MSRTLKEGYQKCMVVKYAAKDSIYSGTPEQESKTVNDHSFEGFISGFLCAVVKTDPDQ
jgi:hypothetical protein